jgi:hypothetical protein
MFDHPFDVHIRAVQPTRAHQSVDVSARSTLANRLPMRRSVSMSR